MKKTDNKAPLSEINKDFEALCKKHKLKKSIFVSEWDKSIILSVHSTNKKTEDDLTAPLTDLFFTTGLNLNALKIVSRLAKEEETRQELYARENKLSKANKIKLLEIRSAKNEYVHKKQYEKASKERAKELKLLGYPVEKKSPVKLDMDDLMNYSPNAKELEKLTADLISATKGWSLNK